MKKSLVALAVLAASGASFAQSSVTLFGVVDLSVRNVNQGGSKVTGMAQDGTASSRLGFRGTEDLGGGMSAGFWLEGATNPDIGTSGGLSFQRRSTLSLSGGFGELRLGRDYVPTFWNHTVFDPFGTNGVGAQTNLMAFAAAGSTALNSGTSTLVRANNSIGYFLPGNLGGIYGQAMYSFKETTLANNANEYTGLRVGYANGPINAAIAFANEGSGNQTDNYKRWNIGASYDLGVAKIFAQYINGEFGAAEQKNLMLGVTAPVGAALLKASYGRADGAGNNDANQIALGADYNLSKRTAVYTTYSRVTNKGAAAFGVAGAGFAGNAAVTPGGKSTGFEFGVRHSF
jgi:predicted porin